MDRKKEEVSRNGQKNQSAGRLVQAKQDARVQKRMALETLHKILLYGEV
jgi:hypothetical protein